MAGNPDESNMNIVFVHHGGPTMASYRYRADMPARELRELGHSARVNEGDADVVVFSKPDLAALDLARKCKAEGTKVIVDFCDDHFRHAEYGLIYREIAELADGIAVPTEEIRRRVVQHVNRDAAVIGDPYEIPRQEPHADGDKLIWFGHQSNIDELLSAAVFLQKRPVVVVTGKTDKINGYVPYSPESLKANLAACHIAFLPTAERGDYKSPNRLMNAVMAGLFVVTGERPSHKEFRDFVWVGPMKGGLQWANAYRSELNALVSEGQDYIEREYSPVKIGKQWETFAKSV